MYQQTIYSVAELRYQIDRFQRAASDEVKLPMAVACDLLQEIYRLRALNAKLVTVCEIFVAWDEDAHSTEVEAGALRRAMFAALAEAREPQQPPQGLPSDTA